MQGFASCTILGNLTRDPALKYTPTGASVCEFGIAVNRKKGPPEARTEEVNYFDVAAFGKTGEVAAQYLSKGRPVAIEGYMEQQRWETQDGQKRSKIAIVANRIHFLPDGRGQGEPADGNEQESQ